MYPDQKCRRQVTGDGLQEMLPDFLTPDTCDLSPDIFAGGEEERYFAQNEDAQGR